MVNISHIPVSEVIKTLCLREGDNNMSMASIYSSYLPAVYNDLRFNVTKKATTKKYHLDLANNSLVLPNDCLLVVGLGYYDNCGNIKPIWYNEKIPLPLLFENSLPCNCNTCGEENTSCGLIKSFDEVEEVVTINGIEKTNSVKTTILNDGTVIKTTKQWGVDNFNEIVLIVDEQEEVCVLDALPCGCIAKNESNTIKINLLCTNNCSLSTNCGSYSIDCCNPISENTYNIDMQGRLLVMSPNYNKNYVIIKYITAINNSKDYEIPAIALEAMIRGVKYYRALDDNKIAGAMRGQNSITHRVYTAELQKLKKRLNPINWDKLMDSLGVMSINKQTHY